MRFQAFGLIFSIAKPVPELSPHRKIGKMRAWTRKGTCPGCGVFTGSKHNVGCAWRQAMLEGRPIE